MKTLTPAVLLSVALSAVSLNAGQLDCATSPAHNQWLRELGSWSAARARAERPRDRVAVNATRDGDVFILPADVTNAPFRRPFDLGERTLIFTPQGGTGFTVRNVPLEWDAAVGDRLQLASGDTHRAVPLNFDFPFRGRTIRTLYVSPLNGIYLETPRRIELRQYSDVDLATEPQPLIAPLLATPNSRLTGTPQVFVRQDGSTASVTWTSPANYSVRATLHSSGEIRFSYQFVNSLVPGAAIVITSGSEEWRTRGSLIAQANDPQGDQATGLSPEDSAMLDITNVVVRRINGLDLFELRIRTRSPIDRSRLQSATVFFSAVIGTNQLRYQPAADRRDRYTLPVWGLGDGSSAGRIENDEIVLTFMSEHIPETEPVTVSAWAYRNGRLIDVTSPMAVALAPSTKTVRTDFSTITESLLDETPIVESFTAPILSVFRVWEQIKQLDPTLTEETIDGVAIYQNFFTDLVMYAGAYSTGGNPGVTGLWDGDREMLFEPRSPALMHMNTIGYGHNSTPQGASRVVLHELGHRWLLFTSLMENGVKSQKLNPSSAHPAQYVDTRAAFRVFTDADTSVMGGGYFTDHHDGSFSSAGYGPYGYSWLDLYLMGLAAPGEVPGMFYIDDSDPALGNEYYAPPDQTFTGVRRNFTVEQIIDATGEREPAFPQTQRSFRVVFVLLSDPDRAVTEEEIAAVNEYRTLLERDFPIATGSRGTVTTSLQRVPLPVRRRAVPK